MLIDIWCFERIFYNKREKEKNKSGTFFPIDFFFRVRVIQQK